MRSINAGGASSSSNSSSEKYGGGSHERVWKLYKFLKIDLKKSEFDYSFSRLSNTLSVPVIRPVSPSPPPPYSPTIINLADPMEELKSKSATTSTSNPAQSPLFLYNGQNGGTWPPANFPTSVSTLSSRILHLASIALLVISYFQLLFLAFFYCRTGLTERTRRKRSLWERVGIRNVYEETLDAWCDRHWIGRRMRREILEPLYGAVSTVGRDQVGTLPVGEILGYIVSTWGTSHYVTEHGVQQVVKRLAAPFDVTKVHLSTTITSMAPSPDSNSTRVEYTTTGEEPAHLDFDYIILATQANQAHRILAKYKDAITSQDEQVKSTEEKKLDEIMTALGEFSYVSTLVINHWDTSILPTSLSDRRDLNLATFASSSSPSYSQGTATTLPRSSIQATHIISRTHPSLTKHLPKGMELLQTTNPIVEIAPELILSSSWYERAKVTVQSKKTLPRFVLDGRATTQGKGEGEGEEKEGGDLQGFKGIYFAGSYCSEGIPLLEGCVTSSERVVQHIVEKEGGVMVLPF